MTAVGAGIERPRSDGDLLTDVAHRLCRLLSGVDLEVEAPGGVVVVPWSWAAERGLLATRAVTGLDGDRPTTLVAVRIDGERGRVGELVADVAGTLLRCRGEMVEQVLGQALDRLSTRTFGGRPLSRMQLVQGTVADSLVALERFRLLVDEGLERRDLEVLRLAATDLDVAEWEVSALLGASAMEDGGSGHHLVELRRAAESWLGVGRPRSVVADEGGR